MRDHWPELPRPGRRFGDLPWMVAARGIDALSDSLVSASSLNTARGMWTRGVEAEVQNSQDVLALRIHYHLGVADADDGEPLLFDARHSPLRLLSVQPGRDGQRHALVSRNKLGARIFTLPCDGQGWRGRTVEVLAEWPESGTTSTLAIPGALPRLVSRQAPIRRPCIKITVPRGMDVASVGVGVRGESNTWRADELVDGALVRTSVEHNQDVVTTDQLHRALGTGIDEFRVRVVTGLADLSRVFGNPVHARIGWQLGDEPWARQAYTSCCHPFDIKKTSKLLFGWQLAAVWWGGGCRLSGPNHKVAEQALRLYSALCWIDQCHSEELALAIETVRGLRDVGVVESLRARIKQWPSPGPVGSLALALLEAGQRGEAVPDVLGSLATAHWSKDLPTTHLFAALRGVGVDTNFG